MAPDIDYTLLPALRKAFEFANEIESYFRMRLTLEDLEQLARHLEDQQNWEVPPTPGTAEPVIKLTREEVINKWIYGVRA